MADSIPWAKLDEGIGLMLQNIQQLIDSADLLYQNRKFMLGASLAVFAYEEISKAELLIERRNNKSDLSLADWKKFTQSPSAHRDKLMKFLEREYSKQEDRKNILNYYDNMKKYVLYVNWEEKGRRDPLWRWFPIEHPEDLQQKVTWTILSDAKRRFASLKEESKT